MIIIILCVIGLFTGGIGAFIYENTITKITGQRKLVISRYKLHHSLYGVLLILFAMTLGNNLNTSIVLFSAGVGVIVEHYITGGGLDFITKEK